VPGDGSTVTSTAKGSRAKWLSPAAVAVVALVMALQPVRSPDVWHHAACGRLVAERGAPARSDPFSHTARGRRWVQYEWLSQLIIYKAYTWFGPSGWMFLRIAAVALAAWLLFLAARLRAGTWAATGAVMLALCGMSERFFTRPEIFTWAIFAALILATEHLRRGLHRLLFVPAALVALWVNVHGAWIAGLAWLGLTCVGDTVRYMRRRDAPRASTDHAIGRGALPTLWLALALSFVATLANPYTVHIWEVPFALSRSDLVTSRIAEWKAPTLAWLLDVRHMGLAVLLLALAAAPAAPSPADWLTVLFFGLLVVPRVPFAAVRHIALLMLVTAQVTAGQLSALGRRLPKTARAGIAALPAVALVSIVAALGGPRLTRAGFGLARDRFPIGAARALARYDLMGNIFNNYEFGNYLIFARHPENPVFIDGRVDMYGDEIVGLYDHVRAARPGWKGILAEHSVELCLVATGRESDAPILRALHRSPDWALVYFDDLSALYVARTPSRTAFLEKSYIYAVPPDSPVAPMLATPEGLSRALRDYTHKLDEDPHCLLARWGRAECLRRLGRIEEAIADYRRAAAQAPRTALLRFTLGAALLEGGRTAEAERHLRAALRLATSAPRESRELRQKALWNLSLALERRGDLAGAVRAMRRFCRLADTPAGRERLALLEDKRKARE